MRRPFPIYPGCPVCGDRDVNPGSLEIRWWWDEDSRRVGGRFVPGPDHTGYADRLHGGVMAALFDEALAWACAVDRRTFCTTGELTVRFQKPIPLGTPLDIEAWTVLARGPYVRAEGVATNNGLVVASARGTYATMPRRQSRALRRALRASPGAVDILESGAKKR